MRHLSGAGMIKIQTHLEFTPGWEEELARAALDQVLKRYEQVLGSLRCPSHGEGVTILVKGRSSEQISFDIRQDCCESLTDEVNRRLRAEGLLE